MAVDLSRLGAFASDPTDTGVPVEFRLFLPDLPDGFAVDVLIIHYEDRFVEGVPANVYPLARGNDGIWTANLTITLQERTHFGRSGRYLYRYRLRQGARTVTEWFTDPFAYVTDDVGALAAFDTPESMSLYEWHDDAWKVPELDQLVIYELQVAEFNATFDGVIDRLPYFYDPEGRPLVMLHRRLASLRASRAALRSWNWYYFYLQSRPGDGVFAYHRFEGNEHAIVLLNFSDTEQSVTVPCPAPGIYTELVDAPYRSTPKQVTGTTIDADLTLHVASNYGYIYYSP